MGTIIKRQASVRQLEALDAGRRKPKGEAARTANSSIRLTPEGKQKLNEKLKQLNLSLADFLEAVAFDEIQIQIQKN